MHYSIKTNEKSLVMASKSYVDYVIENKPYILSKNENINVRIQGMKLYKYILKRCVKNKITTNLKNITLSLFVNSDNRYYDIIEDKKIILLTEFDNNLNFFVNKIKVHDINTNYCAVVNEDNIFNITYQNGRRIPLMSKNNIMVSEYPKYSEYSERTSWNNKDYSWIFDPQ